MNIKGVTPTSSEWLVHISYVSALSSSETDGDACPGAYYVLTDIYLLSLSFFPPFLPKEILSISIINRPHRIALLSLYTGYVWTLALTRNFFQGYGTDS